MKLYIALILVLLSGGMAQAQMTFKFQDQSVSKVLEAYSKVVNKELVIEPSVTNKPLNTITVQTTANPVTKKEAIKMIEMALRDQAGVAIMPLDDKRVSVILVTKRAGLSTIMIVLLSVLALAALCVIVWLWLKRRMHIIPRIS